MLLGDAPLPTRLTLFLETQRAGEQTASQFLYAAMPERYPLVSPATRAVLLPTIDQRSSWQEAAREQFGPTDVENASASVRGLLANFALYEAAKGVLGVESFVDVNAILWHAREMPENRTRPRPPREKPNRGRFNDATPDATSSAVAARPKTF